MSLASITETYVNSFNETDIDGVMEFFHPECVYVTLQGPEIRGYNAIREEFAQQFKGKLGDLRFPIEERIFDEAKQIAVITWDCVHDLAPPPTRNLSLGFLARVMRVLFGTKVRWHGLDVLHFKDGKIIRKSTFGKTPYPAMSRVR